MEAIDYRTIPLGAIKSPEDKRDYTLATLSIAIQDAFPSDFRIPYDHPIKNQGAVGSCCAHSITYCREITEEKQLGRYTQFSVGFVYGMREVGDYQGVGMYPRQALKAMQDYGICEYSAFPENVEWPQVQTDLTPIKDALLKNAYPHRITSYLSLDLSQPNEIKTALMNLGPVTIMIPVYPSFYNINKANPICPIPNTTTEKLIGLHEVTCLGWRGDDTWIVLNSWGDQWGDNGYFYLPITSNLIQEAWSITDNVFPSPGPKMWTSGYKEAIDCSAPLISGTATAMKNTGIAAIGRYLGKRSMNWWKAISPEEVRTIHDAGLSLFLIWESAPTRASYFSYGKGVSDAKLAVDEAIFLGAPNTTAIYFTVDYDAQAGDMSTIVEYFRGVRDGVAGKYLVGAYGSYGVMMALQGSANPPDKYYQTYAWSGGQIFTGSHIYQYQNDTTVEGVAVDRDQIQSMAGTWPELGGGEDMLGVAILLFTKEDYWAGTDVAVKNGNCALFIRPADRSVPKDAMSAKQLIVIGGPTTGHPNEVLLSGNTKYDTAAAVAKYLG